MDMDTDLQALESSPQPAIGEKDTRRFMKILREYHTGLTATKSRIIATEQWWKLRNTAQEQAEGSRIGTDGGFVSRSAWLHNVIVSKHADAMESYPEPKFLPREESDSDEAQRLSDIVPCVLERNGFEQEYSDAMWQKAKTGTAVYKVIWDKEMLNGMGDISVQNVNLLNLYWEPGVKDIQKSPYFFQTELVNRELLVQQYPQLEGHINGRTFQPSKFLYDDTVDTANKSTVVEVYYHRYAGKKRVLHYCKFVDNYILESTENDPELAEKGLYDHGLYPYVFDPLYPVEGSPCGYGFVDVCRNPQQAIDMIKTAIIKNGMVGATPRYFIRQDSGINEAEFLDLNNPLVHVNNLDQQALRLIEHTHLDGNYLAAIDSCIQELRETSGNTETSTGNIQSGVTAASAIAALQEASGKGSRDSTRGSYRGIRRLSNLVVELIRQFYTLPRQFRILGKNGAYQFISYTNQGIKAQHQGNDFGVDMGYRLPVFDIEIVAQKQTAYNTMAQNELAIQLYNLGMFNPQMADQALMCLGMMEFKGIQDVRQKIAKNGTLLQKLAQYMQMALGMAQILSPEMVAGIQADMVEVLGMMPSPAGQGVGQQVLPQENTLVRNARQRSQQAAQPDDGGGA